MTEFIKRRPLSTRNHRCGYREGEAEIEVRLGIVRAIRKGMDDSGVRTDGGTLRRVALFLAKNLEGAVMSADDMKDERDLVSNRQAEMFAEYPLLERMALGLKPGMKIESGLSDRGEETRIAIELGRESRERGGDPVVATASARRRLERRIAGSGRW